MAPQQPVVAPEVVQDAQQPYIPYQQQASRGHQVRHGRLAIQNACMQTIFQTSHRAGNSPAQDISFPRFITPPARLAHLAARGTAVLHRGAPPAPDVPRSRVRAAPRAAGWWGALVGVDGSRYPGRQGRRFCECFKHRPRPTSSTLDGALLDGGLLTSRASGGGGTCWQMVGAGRWCTEGRMVKAGGSESQSRSLDQRSLLPIWPLQDFTVKVDLESSATARRHV